MTAHQSISWDDALRRIGNGEPAQDVIEAKMAADNEDFRAYLLTMPGGGADALAQYDARIRDVDLGITGARNTWHSISGRQRMVLAAACVTPTGRIVRLSVKPSVCVLDGTTRLLCRIPTVRKLCAHELMAWDGGTFEPEAAAVVTERGRFVVAKGQVA